MIERTLRKRLEALSTRHPVITVTGARQSGKTTLCRATFPRATYWNLEAPDVRALARDDSREFVSRCPHPTIIDEVQRVPELLSYIQVEVDENPEPGRFILTGSANLGLLQSVSQSLAGRTAPMELMPLGLDELRRFEDHPGEIFDVVQGGSYPAIYDRGIPPVEWYGGYVGTYVERDVRQLLNVGDLAAFQTFMRLCASRTAQLVNLSGLAGDVGISHNTARSWLSVLEASYLVTRLQPRVPNISKRQVRTPKLHFLDTGLVCYLLGISTPDQLQNHPLRGPIFESWVVSEAIKRIKHTGDRATTFFYRDRKGNEVDLLIERASGITAVETKSGRTVAPDFFRGLDILESRLDDHIELDRVLVYGGSRSFIQSGTRVFSWNELDEGRWCGERITSPGRTP